MRFVISGPVELAMRRTELHDDINQLATLGWVAPIWALIWEHSTLLTSAYRHFSTDRFNHHSELLNIFLHSAGENVSQWTADSPLNELVALHLVLESSLSDDVERRNLDIYHTVAGTVNEFLTDSESEAKLNPSHLINLADACFDIITELERVPTQAIPS